MLHRELREGQSSAAALFLSAPTIRPCQALFNFPPNNILRKWACAWPAQRLFPSTPKFVRPPKSTGFHFPHQPSTIVSSRTESQNRSPDLDRHQLPHRSPDKPSNAVSL